MFEPPYAKPWLLYALLAGSVTLNLVLLVREAGRGRPAASLVSVEPTAKAEPTPAAAEPTPRTAVVEAARSGEGPLAPMVELPPGDWSVTHVEIQGSFASTLHDALGGDGDALATVTGRLFTWDLDLRRDLQPGDRLVVAWRKVEENGVDTIELGAARLDSHKLGRTLTAYRWQAPGDVYASYWHEDGVEMPYRLVSGPLDDYEQITSLLGERRHHKGVDFKTPVGTPVRAPKAGRVERVNWNVRNNGDCVELVYTDGVIAKFLHLSEVNVKPGQRVSAGQIIGRTGNSGRTTAPHLHYQLERGKKVLDPFQYHRTVRRHLDAVGLLAFQQEVSRWDKALDGAIAMR